MINVKTISKTFITIEALTTSVVTRSQKCVPKLIRYLFQDCLKQHKIKKVPLC